MTLSLRRLLVLSLPVLLFAIAAPSASAQIRGLPQQVVTGTTLNEEQKGQIRQFVENNKAGLSSEDPLVMKRARAELEGPLTNPAVSIAFRIEYGRVLQPVLEPLIRGENDLIAANALHLLGELALPIAADVLIETGLRDNRAPVRHAAAFGLKRTFEHLQQSSPVFQERDGVRVIEALASRIATEKDPHVLEGYTRAFEAATGVSQSRVKGIRDAAAFALARSMGEYTRANRANLEASNALIRAAQVLRDTVVAPNEPRLPPATLKEIGGFGGDLIATVACRIKEGGVEADADRLAALAASGENVYYFAHSTLGGSEPLNLQLAPKVRSGRTDDFLKSAEQYIGAAGVLTKRPFELPAARFECGGGGNGG